MHPVFIGKMIINSGPVLTVYHTHSLNLNLNSIFWALSTLWEWNFGNFPYRIVIFITVEELQLNRSVSLRGQDDMSPSSFTTVEIENFFR